MSDTQAEVSGEVTFFDKVDWNLIPHNKITKDQFLYIKLRNKKSYATLLGSQEELQFYMFKPLFWPEYAEAKKKNLDKYEIQEHILKSCLLWPKADVLLTNTLEAGIMLTLVNQILAVSYFISDPAKAMEMILEV